jgi:hypothetical protein
LWDNFVVLAIHLSGRIKDRQENTGEAVGSPCVLNWITHGYKIDAEVGDYT